MSIQDQINNLISSQPEAKQADMQVLHERILKTLPGCRLWFDNGVNEEGKVVTNPTIGYGFQVLKYKDGKTKDFFQIGMCANTTGISVYILGIADKKYLADTYGKEIGKASVTGYCIKFKALKDINIDVLTAAIRYGAEAQN
ncbi:MAG: DUF1801 domain-containing protein [Flavipsychrobacter sp.]|nr:DUF1801 domain-containing protein [Flavipsychrobacter sp.]